MRWNSKTKCSRKCRYSEPERLNVFHRSTYNSHVFNASQRGPLHRRQVRAAVNLPEKPLKIKALVGAGRFERPTPPAQGRFRCFAPRACFLRLTFQTDATSLLKLVEGFG